MKILMSLELDDSLVKSIHRSDDGYVVNLTGDQYLFVTDSKIGLFNKDLLDKVNGDFSQIPTSVLHILQEDSSYDSEHYVYTTQH